MIRRRFDKPDNVASTAGELAFVVASAAFQGLYGLTT